MWRRTGLMTLANDKRVSQRELAKRREVSRWTIQQVDG